MRILLEAFRRDGVSGIDPFENSIGYKLFPYEGSRIFFSHDSIKKFTKSDREVVSDVFIFDPSSKTEVYCLVVIKGQRELPNARSVDKRISMIPQNYRAQIGSTT